MDLSVVIFWFVVLSSISTVVVALARFRSIGKGWIVLYAGVLAICIVGWFWEKEALIYMAAAMWGVLVLLPGMIGQLYHRRFLQQDYASAYRLARIIGWLHPFDGWREQPKIIRAHELAQRGELDAAKGLLESFHEGKSTINVAAITGLYRLAHQWEELLAWHAQRPTAIERHPQLLPGLLRAHGETGDVRGLVELYASHEQQIRKLMPASNRDLSRLVLFAFCGKRQHTERLLVTSLAMLPRWIQEFWLATAELYAGEAGTGRQRLEALLPEATPQTRSAVERRLSHIPNQAVTLEPSAEDLIERIAHEQSQDESFGARRSLFSRQARGTQIIIALNLVTFAAEMYYGGSTKLQVLYRLGALYPKAVWAGEWWRLITAQFLHFGALHLAMNMCALWLFGPFTEFALGMRKFLIVYLIAGIASMGLVMVLGSGANHDQLTVGASGCVMGLIGATAALMLRGWQREKALTAKRRLFAMVAIVAMQTVFDSVVPQVSMTGHLSGTVIGFVVVMGMRDRLGKKPLKR